MIYIELCWAHVKLRLVKHLANKGAKELEDLDKGMWRDIVRDVLTEYQEAVDGKKVAEQCKKRMLRVMKGTIV